MLTLYFAGFSDPVYAEAFVNIQQFDILLGEQGCRRPTTCRLTRLETDVLIVNQTSDTLQDLTIEFATLGDLKLVERPAPHTLGPNAFHNIKATIKVSSTETGVIFGNVVYDRQGGADTSVNIVLNDVHVDIMDYIKPAYVNEAQVRRTMAR